MFNKLNFLFVSFFLMFPEYCGACEAYDEDSKEPFVWGHHYVKPSEELTDYLIEQGNIGVFNILSADLGATGPTGPTGGAEKVAEGPTGAAASDLTGMEIPNLGF